MGKTLSEKILSAKSGTDAKAGDIVISPVDLVFVQDTTGPLTVRQFKAGNKQTLANPARSAVFIDHAAPSPNRALSNDHIFLRQFAADTGCLLYDAGSGVCHQLVAEKLANPGDVIVGADSHTVTAGGLGAFATGMGSSDIAVAWSLGKTWLRVPESFKVSVNGHFPRWVEAKDLILHLIGLIGADGATYKALEFEGSTIDDMPVYQRLTIANMAVEAGAKAGIFPSDRITRDFLKAQGRAALYKPIKPDADAVYERTIEIDANKLEPTVSKPHTVDNTATARDLMDIKINQAFIGTCTNGRLEDIARTAAILKGKKVHAGVRLLVCPGLAPDHGRRYQVRLYKYHHRGRGRDTAARLRRLPGTSPGHIGRRRGLHLHRQPQLQGPHGQSRQLHLPVRRRHRHGLGPHGLYHRSPGGHVVAFTLKGRAFKFGDDISTDLIIAGKYAHLRSNLPELAKHVMEDANPEFASKVQKGDFIVGGSNFGLGSSREHAPLVIKMSGVSAVLAKSFARIFFRNAINQGLPVLVCDYR